MELSVLLLLALLTGLLLLLVQRHPNTHGRLPPGPRPLPLLGNLLQMDRKGLLKSFLRFREKYGDVFTVHLGLRPVVMLCGVEAIREALVDKAEAFSGRGKIAIMDPVYQGYGVIFANGNRWKVLRRFSVTTMRDFGMGKWSVEERIQEEAQCLIEELWKSKGDLVDPTFLFQSITANIICSIIFGKRFNYQDQEFLKMLNLLWQSFSLISSMYSQLFELFSGFLKYFPGPHRQLYKNLQEINAYIGRSVEKHRETLDPSAPQDFIDAYLLRMEKVGSGRGKRERRGGRARWRAKMPYTEAVTHEIQRFVDLLPIGVPHLVTQHTSFRGYIIPKDTEVFLILSTALHDPHYFEKPDAFNPDHFLDANGALKKNEAFIPFSLGKRICLGEGIARTELFLFFTTILQNFSVASPMAPEDIDLTHQECGMDKTPPTYQIRFLPR
uniref:Cytochrome P450 family 2 subfamily B member 6 n=1 Tax=Nomascus leucogenys TaxID=61853 RepID=A0A2I3HJZ4_NOMLE